MIGNMIELSDVLAVFSQSEEQLERYFPLLDTRRWLTLGRFDLGSNSARLIGLCVLADKCKEGEIKPGKLGQLCAELAGLSNLMIETSGVYPWLVAHPLEVRTTLSEQVDQTSYKVWEIVRRLALEALVLCERDSKLPEFFDLFGSLIR